MPASASRSLNRMDVYWADSIGHRNTLTVEVFGSGDEGLGREDE